MRLPLLFISLLLCFSNPSVVRSQGVDTTEAAVDLQSTFGTEDVTLAFTTLSENENGLVTTEPANLEPVEVTTVDEPVAVNQTADDTTSTVTTTESTTSAMVRTTEPTATVLPADVQTTTVQANSTNEPTTTTTEATTIPSTLRTTSRAISSTAGPVHECVTSMSCVDPNAHCVSVAGRNACQCRIGYRKNTNGICVAISTTQLPSTTTSPASINPTTSESSTAVSPTSNPAGSDLNRKKIPVIKAEDLSPGDESNVVSVGFRPATSVIEWIVANDSPFRATIANILTNTGLHASDEGVMHLNITSDQIMYLAPSPERIDDELLVCFVVENSDRVRISPYFASTSIIARHKRDLSYINATVMKYFPAYWVVQALRQNQEILQENLNLTVVTLYGGEVPNKLFFKPWTPIVMFQQNLHVFIPIILATTLFFMIVISVVCVKAKKRTTATWDPPAGIIFGNRKTHTVIKEDREDPLGSVNKMNSSGQNLATDEQCREGEDHQAIKPGCLNSDDDVWVVPFEDGPSEVTKNVIRAQFEDTKL